MRKKIYELISSQPINKYIKKFMESKMSKYFVNPYINFFKVNTKEFKRHYYHSLQDFFTREINLDLRPKSDALYTSPCDGIIVEKGLIKQDTHFFIKGKKVTLKELIGEESNEYQSFQVIYLSPKDYHRFHAIDKNHFISKKEIGNTSIPVNDLGFACGNPFLENHRIILKTEDYAYIPIGATNVNSIKITKTSFDKYDEIGRFEMGSTIVILYKKLLNNLKSGEIKVFESLIK